MRNCLTLCFCCLLKIGLSQTLVPYPDNSLSMKVYHELGVPSLDKRWTSDEYKQVILVLGGTYETDKWALPRKKSPQSENLFNKIIDTDNLDVLTDPSLNLGKRVNELGLFSSHIEQLLAFYGEENEPTERFGIEYLELLKFSAYYSLNAMLLVEEIKELLPQEKRTSTEFLQTYRTIQAALAENIRILISTIHQKNHRFAQKDIDAFTVHAESFIQDSWTLLDESEQNDIIDTIKIVGKKHKEKAVKKQFKTLYKQLLKK